MEKKIFLSVLILIIILFKINIMGMVNITVINLLSCQLMVTGKTLPKSKQKRGNSHYVFIFKSRNLIFFSFQKTVFVVQRASGKSHFSHYILLSDIFGTSI
jgi:hypothetical protein